MIPVQKGTQPVHDDKNFLVWGVEKMSAKSLVRIFFSLLLSFMLVFTPCKAQAGSLVDPNVYAKLKNMAQDYFVQIQGEMAKEGVSPEDAERIIFNYTQELDSQLQKQLRAGALNENSFKKVMLEINAGLILRPDYEPLLKAILHILELGEENLQDIMEGKRPLPPGVQQFYEAVKQEVLYDALSKPDLPVGGGGGSFPQPVENKKVIGKEGGQLIAYNEKAGVEIPAGALDKEVELSINKVDQVNAPPVPVNCKLAGDIYEFRPAGVKFNKNITVILQYDPLKFNEAKEVDLAVYYARKDTNNWVFLGGTVDKQKHTVKVAVDQFSLFAVMIMEKAKAAPPLKPPGEQVRLIDLENHWAKGNIQKLINQGVIGGYPDNTFRPNNSITRAEFTKILVKAMGFAEVKPASPTFADVPSSSWAYGVVEVAAGAGLVKGSEGKFRPDDPITRQEIAVLLVRGLGKEADVIGTVPNFADASRIAPWARGQVIIAVKEGLINGYPDNTIKPVKNSTRSEAAVMVCRMLKL